MNETDKNYYEILGISTNSTYGEIKDKYLQVKKAYNLEGNAMYSVINPHECDQLTEQIEEAYSVLSISHKRREYDQAHGLNSEGVNYEIDSQIQNNNSEFLRTKLQQEKTKITNIVANNKYSLHYDVDPDFEQTLEQATEFSGELLKKIREYKNVNIARMADMTRVSKTYLTKIEDEDIANLPALVYIRGFVYQYAKCLKLNPDIVATSYLKRLQAK